METRKLDTYETLNFEDFIKLIVDYKLDELEYLRDPGIYGIHCFNTNKTCFLETYSILDNLETDIFEITDKLFDWAPEINKDYDLYGSKGFAFVIIHVGPEWIDSRKRNQELLNLKKSWPYKLYKTIA